MTMSIFYNYSTGNVLSTIPELKRAVGQYASRNDYLKIGITKNPEQRWRSHLSERRRNQDKWQKMIVIYQSTSWDSARIAESELIKHVGSKNYYCAIWNDVGGGGGRIGEGRYSYVYVLVDNNPISG